MTVDEMLGRIGSRELAEWAAEYLIRIEEATPERTAPAAPAGATDADPTLILLHRLTERVERRRG